VVGSCNFQQINDSHELLLCNVATVSFIKVLENGLQINATCWYCFAIFIQDWLDILISCRLKILATS